MAVPSNLTAVVRLLEQCPAYWSLGEVMELPVRLTVSIPGESVPVRLTQLTITHKQLILAVAEETPMLELQTYVAAGSARIHGTVVLPRGMSLLAQSAVDRTTLQGSGSWSLRLY